MSGETSAKGGRPEVIDDLFSAARLKVDMVLQLLAEKVTKRVQGLELDAKSLPELEMLLNHLERIIFLNQMNRAKVRDLSHMAPKKYRAILTDAEIMRELRPTRDDLGSNFPKKGPRGPRENVSEEAEAAETDADEG